MEETSTASADNRAIEDLNVKGDDMAAPPCSDSAINVNSSYRQVLLGKGVASLHRDEPGVLLITGTGFMETVQMHQGEANAEAQTGKKRT
jgi:hypothetical protein